MAQTQITTRFSRGNQKDEIYWYYTNLNLIAIKILKGKVISVLTDHLFVV